MNEPSHIAALERLASAETLRDVAEAIGDWRDLGLAEALALWSLDSAGRGFRLCGVRGLQPGLEAWRPGGRSADNPLWRCLLRAEPIDVDLSEMPLALAAVLRATEIDRWQAHPLLDKEGGEQGVVLLGAPSPSGRAPVAAAGAALGRALRADEARSAQRWHRELVHLLRDGVIVATPDGDILAYNQALEQAVGWTLDDVRSTGWTNLVYPDPAVRSEVQRGIAALMLGAHGDGVVRPVACKDGGSLQMQIWSAAVPHPEGGAPFLIGILRDVTQERADARSRWRDESLSKLGRMAGGVAHEFNNLLGAIMGHAELIELDPGASPEVRRRAATIVHASQRGAHLSGQLLAFSGATVPNPAALSPGPLVRELVELFRPAMPPGVRLAVEVEEGLLPVEVDESQLQQALTNLLANAREAADREVRVEVAACPLPVDVRYRAPDAPAPGVPMCRIRVSDDGKGFSLEAVRHLFEPFFTDKARGHGLGLAAVRGIVGLHDGAVDIGRDALTRVDLYLPFSRRPELKLAHLARTRDAGGERVWLVDDEPALLEFARISLEAAGYVVRAFASGAEAMDAAGPWPDLLVVDVVMPGQSGPEVVRALRGRGCAARVLWTSGYSPESARIETEGAHFIQKPFTGNDLARAVAEALDNDRR